MTYRTATSANDTGLKPHTVEAPGFTYSFYRESDANLKTTQGRIEWFCAHFEVEPPVLEFDEDEPDQILLTDALMLWCDREGVSFDWLICGTVTTGLAAFRKRHQDEAPIRNLIARMDDAEKRMLIIALRASTDLSADLDQVMQTLKDAVNEYRAGLPG